jgi:glycerol dehydrogenase-like iron-containing ADH family enzyme
VPQQEAECGGFTGGRAGVGGAGADGEQTGGADGVLSSRPVETGEIKRLLKEFRSMMGKIPLFKTIEEIGREEGVQQDMEEVAKTALRKGMPLETIQELTGLSAERIKQPCL